MTKKPLPETTNKEESTEQPQEDTSSGKEEVKTTKKQDSIDYMDDINYHRMADSFDLDYDARKDVKVAKKLSFLHDKIAEDIGDDDRLKVLTHLKSIVRDLGWQDQGTALIKKLYRWARLDAERKEIEKEMELIE